MSFGRYLTGPIPSPNLSYINRIEYKTNVNIDLLPRVICGQSHATFIDSDLVTIFPRGRLLLPSQPSKRRMACKDAFKMSERALR
jgi:hypothetical protein